MLTKNNEKLKIILGGIPRPIKYLTRLLVFIFVILFILTIIVDIYMDFVYFGKRTVQIVDSSTAEIDYSTKFIFKLNKIEPLNGNCKFDLIIKQYDSLPLPKRDSFQIFLEEGQVMRFESGLVSEPNSILSRIAVMFEYPITQKMNSLYEHTYEKKDIELNLSDCKRGYFYPFDSYTFRIRLHIPNLNSYNCVYFLLDEPSYIHSRPVSIISHGRELTIVPNSVYVSLYRPFYQKIFSIIVILFLLIIEVGQLIFILLKLHFEPIEILSLNISILFGIIGLRPLLVPDNIDFVPLIDLSFLSIIILTFVNIILVLLNKRKANSQKILDG